MKLLIDEEPLQVLPSLAQAIGLNDAIFLQQLHYWLRKSKHEHDEKVWIYNTYEDWKVQFPFWSLDTLQRIAKRLVTKELISIRRFTESEWDRTNWYTINYEKLGEYAISLEKQAKPQIAVNQLAANCGLLVSRKLRSSYKDQEITQKNTQERDNSASRIFTCWKETMKKPKARLDAKRSKVINARLKDGYSVDDLCVAIRGCAESPFHMGQNDRFTLYNDLTLICRDAAHVDKFIEIAQSNHGYKLRAPEDRAAREAELKRKMGWDKFDERRTT